MGDVGVEGWRIQLPASQSRLGGNCFTEEDAELHRRRRRTTIRCVSDPRLLRSRTTRRTSNPVTVAHEWQLWRPFDAGDRLSPKKPRGYHVRDNFAVDDFGAIQQLGSLHLQICELPEGKAYAASSNSPMSMSSYIPAGGIQPMTRTDHRLGDTYRRNHPLLGNSSDVDRRHL